MLAHRLALAHRVAFTHRLALSLLAACAPGAVAAATLTGAVLDRAGKPVEFANVVVRAAQVGGVTDEQGRFTLALPAGRHEVEVSQIGYVPLRRSIDVGEPETASRFVLAEEPVPVGEVVVSASSFGRAGGREGATLRRMDVVMTPGGAADVFQALRTLPGISAPNEGAAVYVRGGDPHETLVRLDGGELGHPYHYEDASGGLFSSFDAYMLKSALFSSGGFSAKYGGVLSGVLDIETQDPWNLRTVSVGANLAGASVSSSWALVPDRVSFVGAARASRTDLLERLYGSARDYVSLPRSADGVGKLLYRYAPAGRVSLLLMGAGDGVEVQSHRYNYEGVYHGSARNRLALIQWRQALAGRLALSGNVTAQEYSSLAQYGVLDLTSRERRLAAGLDALWEISPRQQLGLGVSFRGHDAETEGRLPADSTDLGPGAPTRLPGDGAILRAPGFYAEHRFRVSGAVYATLGARADYASTSDQWTTDPRLALAWLPSPHQSVRLAAGRYHQLPQAATLDPIHGNPRLRPAEADHVIAGYEWKTEVSNARLEVFEKRYRRLVTRNDVSSYGTDGHGYARGVDVLLQRSRRNVSGWISYGYLDSRRKELDDPREVPAAHGVRHALTLVGTWQATPVFQLGARFSHSSGRAYTPVIGGRYDAATGRWSPVEAESHSGRMPDYRRLDIRLTRLFSLPGAGALPASNVCAVYVETLNALGTRNVLDYAYNQDYSRREAVDSYFSRRLLVAGFALTW